MSHELHRGAGQHIAGARTPSGAQPIRLCMLKWMAAASDTPWARRQAWIDTTGALASPTTRYDKVPWWWKFR